MSSLACPPHFIYSYTRLDLPQLHSPFGGGCRFSRCSIFFPSEEKQKYAIRFQTASSDCFVSVRHGCMFLRVCSHMCMCAAPFQCLWNLLFTVGRLMLSSLCWKDSWSKKSLTALVGLLWSMGFLKSVRSSSKAIILRRDKQNLCYRNIRNKTTGHFWG